jgi:hypothetical protein
MVPPPEDDNSKNLLDIFHVKEWNAWNTWGFFLISQKK